MKNNGEYLDLHCGGIDNAFPHHTNEVAQSEAYLGHPWCGSWFHVHHLNTDSGKMSKSKGEFLTVSLLEQKGYDPLAYRFFCLQSHYRKGLMFSWENLDNAAAAYSKLVAKIAQLENSGSIDEAEYSRLRGAFAAAMDNDLNTSLAITALYDVLKSGLSGAGKLKLIADLDEVLSLGLISAAEKLKASKSGGEDIPPEVAELLEQRKAARKEKNFVLADELRDKIAALGYAVEETREGTKLRKL